MLSGVAPQKAGLVDVQFHNLRHTFASRLVIAGADLRAVQELMGHADIRMTQCYAHLSASHKQNVAYLLDRGAQQFSQQGSSGGLLGREEKQVV